MLNRLEKSEEQKNVNRKFYKKKTFSYIKLKRGEKNKQMLRVS